MRPWSIIFTILVVLLIGGFLLQGQEYLNSSMLIISPAFEEGGTIPKKFTCDGGSINPELIIQNLPQGTQSLALIMDDPDAPRGTFTHWVLWNINPDRTNILQESVPVGSTEGMTSAGKPGYVGPCPPSGTHRYFFRLYALGTVLDGLPEAATRADLETAMNGHILAQAELMGTYSRSR